jgi:hypothetical protein
MKLLETLLNPVSHFYTGQVKIAVTGTAVQLPTHKELLRGVTITANKNNAGKATIGFSSEVANTVDGSGDGYVLDPGESVEIEISDSNFIYINGSADDWISFIAR